MYVPQYKNLSLEKIFEYIGQVPQIEAYLPDEIDIPKIPKQWIVNVCASILGQNFRDWVTQQIQDRNTLIAEKKEIMINMDPQLAAKFQASTHVSRKWTCLFFINVSVIDSSLQGHLFKHIEGVQQEKKDPGPDQGRKGSC